MKILDRYLWKELLTPLLIGIFVATFLLLIDQIHGLTDLIINKGVPVHLVLLLLTYLLPSILVLTIPIGLLFAILVAFGRLSTDMEVVALKAAGVGPMRLLRPVLVLAAGAAIVTALLLLEAMPRANYGFKSLIFRIVQTQAAVGLRERVFNDTFGNFVIYVDELAPDHVTLRNVFVSDERKPEELRVITAAEGRLLTDAANRRVTLRLLRGTVHETTPVNLQKYRQVGFRLYDITLVLDNPLARQGDAPKGDREMTVAELRATADEAIRRGANANPFLVEIHKKYAIPAACLVFAVVGVPLGIRTHRGGRWAAFVMLLPIVLFYHVGLSVVGEPLADRGWLPPWLAMWGPNLVVGALGLHLLRRSVRQRPTPLLTGIARIGWALASRFRRLWQVAAPRPRRAPSRLRPRTGVPRRNALYRVDWYVMREFATLFAYGMALTTVVVIIADLMTTIDRYIRLKTPFALILEHFLYRTPPFVYQGLHIVVLMSTILLFLGLSRSNELTALKAGGISLYRVSLPVFALAAVITGLTFGFQEMALPVLNQKGVEVDEAKIKRRTLPQLQKRSQIWYRSREGQSGDSRIYHLNLLDPANKQATGVSILELDQDFGVRRRWDARGMRWLDAAESWELRDAIHREFRAGRPDRVESFPRTVVTLPERFADFAQVPRAPDVMNYVELSEYIDRLQEAGHKVAKYVVDLHSKIAYPFALLIMALVGIPFALQSPRGGRMIGIAICLVLGLGYFLVHSAGLALARNEILPPIVAAWVANALFATLGLFLFLRAPT